MIITEYEYKNGAWYLWGRMGLRKYAHRSLKEAMNEYLEEYGESYAGNYYV